MGVGAQKQCPGIERLFLVLAVVAGPADADVQGLRREVAWWPRHVHRRSGAFMLPVLRSA